MARGSGRRKSPSGVQGRSPDKGPGKVPQKLKQNVKLVYNLYRFPVENLGFNEYGSRAWTVLFANTIKKILKIKWGSLNAPSGYADRLT